MKKNKDRRFWVPYDITYSDYMGNAKVNEDNFNEFEAEQANAITNAKEVLYPQLFLYLRDYYVSLLDDIAEGSDGNKEVFMKNAIKELSACLSKDDYLLMEGEAIAIGIELGRYLALFDALEKFDVVFSKLMGVDE